MDQGTEWVLMLHVHEGLALSRNCSDKQLFVASSSKKVSTTINLCNDVSTLEYCNGLFVGQNFTK